MRDQIKKLAKLLRTSNEVVFKLEQNMEKISGKKGAINSIVQENTERVEEKLKEMGLNRESKAKEVFDALLEKARLVDEGLHNKFYKPEISTEAGCQNLINTVKELVGDLSGFYLKPEKAKDLFRLNPPKKVMASLGYDDLEEMLKKEDIFELFASLRFAEDSDWMNNVFFGPYKDLTKDDFEKRDLKVMVLPEKWTSIGKKFLGKKLHHMSHLKELGLVFIIPVDQHHPGEIIYLFFMTLHYIHETDWFSELFEKYSQDKDGSVGSPQGFAKRMIEALKVKAGEMALSDNSWRIIPSYLAKKNENDPRLAEPHINPEALFFARTSDIIQKFSDRFPEIGLGFWKDLDITGEYFTSNGSEKLISFDLFDNGVYLQQGQTDFNAKYLYHQQEALWNEIFVRYLSEDELNKVMIDNLDKGFVVL